MLKAAFTGRSDNQAAVDVIQVASSTPHLQAEALEMHRLYAVHSIQLMVEWVPWGGGGVTKWRLFVNDRQHRRLEIKSLIFRDFRFYVGPHALDCFASHITKQISKLCSRW